MNRLYLDIETIPAEPEKQTVLKALHEKRVKEGRSAKSFEEVVEESGLNGAFGRICCLGYAQNDDPVRCLSGDEITILNQFWQLAKKTDLFVGFNLFDFDLRFIWQRSIILGVTPAIDLPFVRHTSSPIYDIMYEWSRWSGGVGSRISLDALAQALNLPSPKNGSVSGRTVAKAYSEGRIAEICAYCSKDVEVTRSIYKRITFPSLPPR